MGETVDVTVYRKYAKNIHWEGAYATADGKNLQFSLNNMTMRLEAKSLRKKLKVDKEKKKVSIRLESDKVLKRGYLKITFHDLPSNIIHVLNDTVDTYVKSKKGKSKYPKWKRVYKSFLLNKNFGRAHLDDAEEMERTESDEPLETRGTLARRRRLFSETKWDNLDNLELVDFDLEKSKSADQEADQLSDNIEVAGSLVLKRQPSGVSETSDSSKKPRSAMEKPKEYVKPMARPPKEAVLEIDRLKKEPETILEKRNIYGQRLFGSFICNSRIVNSHVTGATITNCTIENSTIIASTITTDNMLE